ncbi:unnamed protein product [Rotaria socialis]|nr:unnamed protein product [Rotaria socialis]CAF3733845.1 unnamed protein product [Rotaria socialis]
MIEARAYQGIQNQPTTRSTTSHQTLKSSSSSSISITRHSSLSNIEKFKNLCRRTSTTTATTSPPIQKPNTLSIKEEFSLYMSSYKESIDFETFWNERQKLLPILSSLVRRYSIIPATSVASESVFFCSWIYPA